MNIKACSDAFFKSIYYSYTSLILIQVISSPELQAYKLKDCFWTTFIVLVLSNEHILHNIM